MDNELKCPICGEPTLVYYGNPRKDRLCAKHGKMANAGEIEQCPDCGKWHNADEECECKKPAAKTTNTDELTCIICGQPSNGKHFCIDCYRKFKNKVLYLQVKQCKEFIKLDAEYESDIICEDGHPVKSQQEAMIDDYLFNHNIKHVYEKPFPIDENPEHDLHPDFYLPDLDIYIEHFGIVGNKRYEESKDYKLPIYQKKGITLICTTGKDIKNLSANLERKLQYYKKGEINFIDD